MNVYEFGPFRLHAERLSLKNARGPIALGPKVVETLLALVERSGETLSKDQLLDRVWPEGFVEEANLTQNIYVLRKTLRDGGLADAIETVPRVGYRFAAPARLIGQRAPRRPFAAAVAAAAFVAVIFILGTSIGLSHRHAPAATVSTSGARLYEIGRYYWGLRTSDGVRKSLYYFTKMVDADPGSARGYAALADANIIMGDYCYGTHLPAVYLARARAYADKALALDPNSSEALASLGFLALDRDDVPSALADLRRAIALDASNATAHQWYGIALVRGGDSAEGVRELKLAQKLDPLSVVTTAWLGSLAYQSGRFDEAIRYAAQTLELAPDRIDALRTLGEAYEATGDLNRAIRAFERYAAADQFYRPDAAQLLARAYTEAGNSASARAQFAYARKYGQPHRFGSENSMRLLLGGSGTALGFVRADPNGLNVDEFVYAKT